MHTQAIGIFDSGIGGLTVLKEIMTRLPHENFIYFGDTARVPYGGRSTETVTKYTSQCINFLLSKKVKAIVAACNTASALGLPNLKKNYNIPIIGVVNSGALAAVKTSKQKRIGVIGTTGTITSKAYETALLSQDKDIVIFSKACPLFVPLAEEGWGETNIAKQIATKYLQDILNKNIDTLIMGCTHYPLLEFVIKQVVGDKIELINPAIETAYEIKRLLTQQNILNLENKISTKSYFVSDRPPNFRVIGENFLKSFIDEPNLVEIDNF